MQVVAFLVAWGACYPDAGAVCNEEDGAWLRWWYDESIGVWAVDPDEVELAAYPLAQREEGATG